jgi:ADP-ribosylglycohydrolase
MEKIWANHQHLESKIKWALLLWALWDALWVPTEMRKQRFLQEKYWVVSDFLPTKDNLFFDKKLLDSEKKWYYSDDTVLTFAILRSLTEIGGIDMEDIWKKQIEWYKNRPYWFGRVNNYSVRKNSTMNTLRRNY